MARGNRGRPVRCIETGEVYPSAKAASLALGVTPSAVAGVLSGYTKTARGYHWEYVDGEQAAAYRPRTAPSVKPKEPRPALSPRRTIPEVLAEARRRTAMTGTYHGYGDIQKEETVQLIREGRLPCRKRDK